MTSFQSDGYEAEADARSFVLDFWQGRFDPTIGALSTQYALPDGVPTGFHATVDPAGITPVPIPKAATLP